MPTYLHPGVYIEEVAAGARPIEAVGTSTAAFVGIAEKGPIDEARFITNFTEFQQIYGGYVSDKDIGKSFLAYSVYQFLQNGGAACYVVRVEHKAMTAELELRTNEERRTMTIKAISPGSWGNKIKIAIAEGTTLKENFNMYVFLEDELKETYEDLSMVDYSPYYVDRVTKRSLYIKTESGNLSDYPEFIGKVDLSSGIDLSKVNMIRLKIDNAGPDIIDCSGGNPGVVDIDSIVRIINEKFFPKIKENVASIETAESKKYIKIKSPTANADSMIVFTPPDEKDATENIFGLVESSWVEPAKATDTKKIALAYGMKDLSSPTTVTSTITFQHPATGADFPVDVSGEGIWAIVNALNTAIQSDQSLLEVLAPSADDDGRNLAWTDGKHLILKTDKDIRIRRETTNDNDKDAINKIFDVKFYAYTFLGSGDDPAKIAGKTLTSYPTDMNNGRKYLRIKVDNFPVMIVDLSNTTDLETVVKRINTVFRTETKKRENIAAINKLETGEQQLVLTSTIKGEPGRLILMNCLEDEDATTYLLGTEAEIDLGSATKQDYFLIPADSPHRAILESEKINLASDFSRSSNVLGHSLRFTVDGRTEEIEGNDTKSLSNLQSLFEFFSSKSTLNHRLLTDYTAPPPAPAHIDFISFVTGEKTDLRFSIPLKGFEQEIEIHEESSSGATIGAYRGIFGDTIEVFKGDAKKFTAPNYEYKFLRPNNNPAKTVIESGEELDFSQSLSLGGGSQDRTKSNILRDLTVGSVSGVTSGIRLLDKLTDISILVIPGWSEMDEGIATSFINGGTAYCDNKRPNQARPLRDLFFITNTPSSVTTPIDAREFVKGKISYRSSGGYASIYYPWIMVNDPIGTASPTFLIPPAGSIAGLYARIDARRGVWKAPAGTEAGVAEVVSLADQVTDTEQDRLNPHGVNAIRRMPGAGIVAWGARTLATNPEWKYIPVRRTAIMIEVSIYEGIQWAVFEPNDENLWSLLRLNIGAFMMTLFRNGAFQGSTPDEAFFVKCDSETTTQNDIDLGRVNILVGFAPLKPAEFVIVKISQKAGQKE